MRKVELESRILEFIQRHNLISPGEMVVVGVSGGADSVCLLHVLARWQKRLGIKLHAAHLNHQLRGAESEADAKYVSNLAGKLSIPIIVDRQDVAAYKAEGICSIEEAARELRYNFLAGVASDVGANRVATGHTRDDQVETILMHILRGTGTSGLCGLQPCSPMVYSKGTLLPAPHVSLRAKRSNLLVIRPLLNITKEETLNYCREQQLEPRVDSSNLSLSFLRNRCRLELLPLLRGYNPKVDEALLRLAEIAKDDNSFMEQQAFALWNEVARQEDATVYLNKRKICALPIALQRQLLRLAIAKVLGNTKDIEVNHIEAMRNLLSKPVGKRTSLPHGLTCHGEYGEVVIASLISSPLKGEDEGEGGKPQAKQSQFPPCSFPPLHGELSLKVPGETKLPGWRVIASIVSPIGRISPVTAVSRSPEYSEVHPPSVIASAAKQSPQKGGDFVAQFDLHQTGTKLSVHQRQSGDRFQPLGMNTSKKLQDFMVDAKIPLAWRERIPLVCSPQQIIWVVGWRIDDRVKATETTKETLRLEFISSS